MKFLRIFLWMQLIFTVLMLCPITFQVSYRDKLHFRIRYLFFHYTVAPHAPKKKKPKKKKKPAGKSFLGKIGELYQKEGLSGFLSILKEVAGIAGGLAKGIFSHLVFSHFWLKISVSGGDAARTAVYYGYVCSVVSTATGAILKKAKCKECHVLIDPDFQSEKSSVKFDTKVHILPFFLINAVLRASIRSVKLIKSITAIHNN